MISVLKPETCAALHKVCYKQEHPVVSEEELFNARF